MKMSAVNRPVLVLFLCALLAVSGCAVKLIASYDEATDRGVSALQRKVETFLVELESKDGSPECSYENNKSFYSESKVDLSVIRVRAEAIPKNEITISQISLLAGSLDNLEALHQYKDKKSDAGGTLSCISKDEIAPIRTVFNSSFTAILKLELAKKRGEK